MSCSVPWPSTCTACRARPRISIAVQYAPPQEDFHIDILTRLGERYAFADLAAQRIDVGGLAVPVVTWSSCIG